MTAEEFYKQELSAKVGESLGAASMCWNPRPGNQVFDDTLCAGIDGELSNDIIDALKKYADHCEESAWITDGSFPVKDNEDDVTSTDVITVYEGSDTLGCDCYVFTEGIWLYASYAGKTVIAWRYYPKFPGK